MGGPLEWFNQIQISHQYLLSPGYKIKAILSRMCVLRPCTPSFWGFGVQTHTNLNTVNSSNILEKEQTKLDNFEDINLTQLFYYEIFGTSL